MRESIEGRADFDLVVVDAAATGHIVAQLGAPDAIQRARRRRPAAQPDRSGSSELLADPAITAVNVVTTPEEMPVAETIELVARLRAEVDVPLGVGDREPGAARAVHPRRRGDLRGAARARTRADAAHRARRARARPRCSTRPASRCRCAAPRAAHLDELRDDGRPAAAATCRTCSCATHGLRVTRMVADALGEELGL